MEAPERKFQDHSRVKLRDGVNPGFYEGLGLVGMEGWIRKHQPEKYGYQRVFIEWDQDHWAYNGVSDGWTWEGHFDLVEEPKVNSKNEKKEKALDALASLADMLREDDKEDANDELLALDPISEEDEEPSYDETFAEAVADAKEAEAFFLIAVRKEEHHGKDMMVPVAYHGAKDDKSSLLCQLQLTHLTETFIEGLIMDRLHEEALDERADE